MERFADFLQERLYLIGVSKKTVDYYTWAFNAWKKHAPTGDPKEFVINLRQSGVSAISVNTYICAMNTYWKWAKEGKHLDYLKEEQKILATLSESHIRGLIAYRPRGTNATRAHLIALTILDTGLRASEVLGLPIEKVNWDSLVLTVQGKGNKQRLVPFSLELRKLLFRYVHPIGKVLAERRIPTPTLLFGTKNNTQLSVRNFERDLSVLGKKVDITGIRFSPHTLRHTFAVQYLKNGGNLEFLRRILGHSSLLTTQKYLRSLGVSDLAEVHNSLSPLGRR
jgi:integrase/recombinase XerD